MLIAILILALTAVASPGWALDCSVENLYLGSQAEVNDFQTLYGSGGTCDTVTGTLQITGPDIADLTPLSDLTTIGGLLKVTNNPPLESLDGLSGITSVGIVCYPPVFSGCLSINVSNNAALTNIDALGNLTGTAGEVEIMDNPLLTNLDGLSGMVTIGRGLLIIRNQSLVQIDGLSAR
jgi:hypothetical protein